MKNLREKLGALGGMGGMGAMGGMGGIGVAGVTGIGLLLFCLSLFFGHLLPMQNELSRLESERETLAATRAATAAANPVATTVANPAATAAAQGPTAASARAERPLLPLSAAPEQLKQLNALATRHGIVIERATYQMKDQAGQTRLEVSMPLNLSYPVLRAYLRDVLAMPTAVLEELMLQRGKVSDAMVEAQLRLSFGFASAP